MSDKQQILAELREEFKRWQDLLAGLNEDQITAPPRPSDLSIQDVVAHLMAWQQLSIARLEAAKQNRQPDYPDWFEGTEPVTDQETDRVNARIYVTYREQPWSRIYADWKSGFQKFLQLGEAIPEADLLDRAKYPWLDGYALIDVLRGSLEHHHDEHREPLLAWLREHGM